MLWVDYFFPSPLHVGGLPNNPELGNSLLVCATEMRTKGEIDQYAEVLERVFKL